MTTVPALNALILLVFGGAVGFVAGRLLWPGPIDLPESTLDLIGREPRPWVPESAPIPADVKLDVHDDVPPAIPRPLKAVPGKTRKPAARAKRVRP